MWLRREQIYYKSVVNLNEAKFTRIKAIVIETILRLLSYVTSSLLDLENAIDI